MSLRLDYCKSTDARRACELWHYTKTIVPWKKVTIGVWENGDFVGAIVYGLGARVSLGGFVGLDKWKVCELCRVALGRHKYPVSRMLSVSLKLLKKVCPGIRCVVSYADATRGHHGGIYQGAGWTYVGSCGHGKSGYFLIRGKVVHSRSVHSRGWRQSLSWLRENIDKNIVPIGGQIRYKYAWAFDDEIRRKLDAQRKPYPKRATSETGDTTANHAVEGGSTPTVALTEIT